MISIEDSTRVVRLFSLNAEHVISAFRGSQRRMWVLSSLSFIMIDCGTTKNSEACRRDPMLPLNQMQVSEAPFMRQYLFWRNSLYDPYLDENRIWSLQVQENYKSGRLIYVPLWMRGDSDQAASDLMEAILRS